MPALIGGFGKINKQRQKYTTIESGLALIPSASGNLAKSKENFELESLRSKLAPYLVGLIEADGSFAIHDKYSKAKRYLPKILIVFSLDDIPLANKLLFITKVGRLYVKNNQGCVIWQIQKIEDVIKTINIVNGFMRTPKIEALHRAVEWYNNFKDTKLEPLGLDLSPIDSNVWLAGFSDGDGNFSINLTDRKKKGAITSKRVQVFFLIELRQDYHREASIEQGGTSYLKILSGISIPKHTFINKNFSFGHTKFKFIRNYSTCSNNNNYMLNSYLTGLIESSGTFVLPSNKTKVKSRLPKLLVVFKLSDCFLVKELISITKIGVLCKQKSSIIWEINNEEDFLNLIFRVNGYMRSPKINLFSKAIDFYNKNCNMNIKCLDKDLSSIDSNAWFAGFSQNNTTFHTTMSKSRIILRHALLVNIVVPSIDFESNIVGYTPLFCKISEYLKTSFITRIKNVPYKKCTIIVEAFIPKSKDILVEYFNKFPLLGKISLEYEHWLKYYYINLNKNKNPDFLKKIDYKFDKNLLRSDLLCKNLNNYLLNIDLRGNFYTASNLLHNNSCFNIKKTKSTFQSSRTYVTVKKKRVLILFL